MNQARHDATRSAVISQVTPLTGVRAGSALVRVGDRLLIAQDDDYTLFWLHPDGTTQAHPLRAESGAMAKAAKPDFEAAAALPDGRILVIGSGSAYPRRFVVLMDPSDDTFEIRDATRIYLLVEEAVGHELNIEGMVATASGLRIFHRGNSGDGNVIVDLVVDPDSPADARVSRVQRWQIGTVPGAEREVPLTFTDAHLHPDGDIWFLAAAEDTPNAIDDGPVVGAALGLLRDDDPVYCLLHEADGTASVRKAEGLVVDPDRTGAWLVTDPDDEDLHAELCRVELSGWQT